MTDRMIKVNYLARVEGEGALKVRVRGGIVEAAELNIFEPPRFFEALLRGRAYTEAPDITARICGICPVAYQMSAVHAMEDALGVTVPEPIRVLRRLLYCGEWIESHALHVFLLHAPDFLGYENAVAMAKDHGEAVQRGLALKKAGNALVAAVGGREVHPVNVRVGGFYRAPRRRDLVALRDGLERARDVALWAVGWTGGFNFPDCERDYEFVALRHERDYPFSEGRIVSSRGLDIPVRDYPEHFEETHLPRTTALRSRIRERGAYLTGPMARYSLNHDRLSPVAREAAAGAGLGTTCANPYRSIVVRAVEALQACDEALRIIDGYEEPEAPAAELVVRADTGHGATEAPRGLLYHRYRLAPDGSIEAADIVPPTAQNQASIEEDLTRFIPDWLDMDDAALQWRCEQTVRNYDPCISCATHFLRLEMDRRP
ncbi:MAG: Ni/Fe hydrogenase subunit alpha [Alphaproteobacteria bacterium]|nr:Ni/Fe hydrogenase subunit alpha [Alphaproteobacteria bacterium]